MRSKPCVAGVLVCLTLPGPALAEERGTPEEARQLLGRAVALVEEAGEKKALAAFNDRDGAFVDRDLYVFCLGPDYKITAHIDSGMRGVDVHTLTDPDGKEIGWEMIEIGKRGGGSLEYRWVNPLTREVEPKITFLAPAGDQLCGVGAYK
jgi:signal transduction histidine kinase